MFGNSVKSKFERFKTCRYLNFHISFGIVPKWLPAMERVVKELNTLPKYGR